MSDYTSSTTSAPLSGSTGHLCIGCGRRPVKLRRTYCGMCKTRMAGGGACDVDDIPTVKELVDAIGIVEEPSNPFPETHRRHKK